MRENVYQNNSEYGHFNYTHENYYLKSHIRQLTCYKNTNNLTCIDLMLTNISRNINSIAVIETGLSDFHLLSLISYEKIH